MKILNVRRIKEKDSDNNAFVRILKDSYINGDALVYLIDTEVSKESRVNISLGKNNHIAELLSDNDFLDLIPDIHHNNDILTDNIHFKNSDPYGMFGAMCSIIHDGGAYDSNWSRYTSDYIINEVRLFLNSTFSNWIDSHCYISSSPWSTWFKNVAWDYTLIFITKDYSKMLMIVITDTD